MSTHIEPQAYDLAYFWKAYSISRSFAYLKIKAEPKTLISREAAEALRHGLEGFPVEAVSCSSYEALSLTRSYMRCWLLKLQARLPSLTPEQRRGAAIALDIGLFFASYH